MSKKQPAYYILLKNKDKKKICYEHVEDQKDEILFRAISGDKHEFKITKRDLQLNLEIGDADIGKDLKLLLPPVDKSSKSA